MKYNDDRPDGSCRLDKVSMSVEKSEKESLPVLGQKQDAAAFGFTLICRRQWTETEESLWIDAEPFLPDLPAESGGDVAFLP